MGSSSASELCELKRDVMLLEVEKLLYETEKLKEERDNMRQEKEMLELEHQVLLRERERLEVELAKQNLRGNGASNRPSTSDRGP
ncbi:myb/SANT-like DNA-binding domain-containing protein 4 [Frankliniella occidentalis]|uniref:Myb/SANT-like DNA-binding domain-containing protein 4 n=1 Tax=Frankliniella occidentalis TaxID=133901 RepID=A0A6J1SID5_FRAOC|nr:myb/SANT-like DNA-binding domain-containing protein 4 [Frankliniella occidentalis]